MASISSTVTYLEMASPPSIAPPPPPAEQHAIMRAENPSVYFYRYLYNGVGEKWMWWERNELSDDELSSIITDEKVEIYVLYIKGVPAGYVELDFRDEGNVEIAYLGMMEEFTGRGLGVYMLYWAIHLAWAKEGVGRIWLHTCNQDHPGALAMYQRAGFNVYNQETITIKDPRS